MGASESQIVEAERWQPTSSSLQWDGKEWKPTPPANLDRNGSQSIFGSSAFGPTVRIEERSAAGHIVRSTLDRSHVKPKRRVPFPRQRRYTGGHARSYPGAYGAWSGRLHAYQLAAQSVFAWGCVAAKILLLRARKLLPVAVAHTRGYMEYDSTWMFLLGKTCLDWDDGLRYDMSHFVFTFPAVLGGGQSKARLAVDSKPPTPSHRMPS